MRLRPRVPANSWHLALLVTACLTLASCRQAAVIDTRESFTLDSPYHRKLPVPATVACEGARRALLGDGYLVERVGSEGVRGRKAFRTGDDQSTFVEMSVECTDGPAGSALYANALLSAYDVKRSTSSASLGLAAIGSVSLPIGQSADTMVKTAEETITERDFYARFFAAVEVAVAEMSPGRTAPGGLPPPGTMPEPPAAAPEGDGSRHPEGSPTRIAQPPAQATGSPAPGPGTMPTGSDPAAPAPSSSRGGSPPLPMTADSASSVTPAAAASVDPQVQAQGNGSAAPPPPVLLQAPSGTAATP